MSNSADIFYLYQKGKDSLIPFHRVINMDDGWITFETLEYEYLRLSSNTILVGSHFNHKWVCYIALIMDCWAPVYTILTSNTKLISQELKDELTKNLAIAETLLLLQRNV